MGALESFGRGVQEGPRHSTTQGMGAAMPSSRVFGWTPLLVLSLAILSAWPALAEPPRRGEGKEGEDKEVEEISIEEYNRRASESPDQAPVGSAPLPVLASPAGLDWLFVGPRPIRFEYWSGNDNAGGRVSSIVVHPGDANTLYLAAAQGGVWKTTDGGLAWVPLTDQLSSLASGALALDPANPSIVYYGTGEQHFSGDSYYGDGLFRSLDAGANWTKIATKASVGSYLSRVVLKPIDSNVILLGSDRGVMRSTDGGSNWTNPLSPNYCTDLTVDPVTPATWFAAIRNNGIYKSTNDGASWAKLSVGLPASGFGRINFAMAPSNPLVIYASFVAASGGGLLGLYKTTDGGITWSFQAGTPNYLGGQGWYDNCVIVDPTNANVFYAGGVFPYGGGAGGVIKTTDGGASWTNITIGFSGQLHPDQHCFAFAADGALWVGNDGGVWKTSDGGSNWINRNNDLGIAQLYTVSVHPAGATFMLGGTQDNGTLRYSGTVDWPQLIGGDGGPNAVEWDTPDIYYSTYVNLSSIDKWSSGSYLGDVAGPWAGDRASWCNGPLVVDVNQVNTLLAGTYRVWRTTNGGGSWTQISTDLTGGNGHLRALAIAAGLPNTIYSGSSNGRVYVTTDASAWTLRSTGLPAVPIPDIGLSPSDWQTAYLCSDRPTSDRVFRTTDAGVNWTSITGDLPSGVRAQCMVTDFRVSPPRHYVGTDYGVYVSANEGATWVKASATLPNCAIFDLAIDAVNDDLVAATHGRGLWRAALDLVAPTATLTAPAGGEAYGVNRAHDITWNATDANGVEVVDLLLSVDDGASFPATIAAGVPNTGSFPWTTPSTTEMLCRVKVVAYDPQGNHGEDVSDQSFSVIDSALVAVGPSEPAAFALRPVAPNPLRPPAVIGFDLPRRTPVSLEIFDVMGRSVRALENGALEAGTYTRIWDGRDRAGRPVTDGVYFYRLLAGALQQTRRMVMVR
jgi:photosystem II stability/assembly factor-like uncharacterized protein